MNRWPDHASTGPNEHSPVAALARTLIDAICDSIAGWLHPLAGAATVPLLLLIPLLVLGVGWLAARRVRRRTNT
ncbi:hypothetical protein ACW2Q0_05305 [Nocardia sp. R16R-3T]